MTTIIYTIIAMCAFAANSILCRIALLEGQIDAGSFTIIRIVSGAITLIAIWLIAKKPSETKLISDKKSFLTSSISLFIYALLFSFAYIKLGTGTGALILFGIVQLSMLTFHIVKGNRLTFFEWVGIAVAVTGFLILLLPSATRPDLFSALLMGISGLSWAIFTLQGKRSGEPLRSTTQGFMGSAALSVICLPWLIDLESINQTGMWLAVISGAVTSALGYVIWYSALRGLTVLSASIVQLSVPAIALVGGLFIVSEPLSMNIILSTACILGGIALVFLSQKQLSRK
ncbi:DMT family transporter [Vibrio sp. TH_r3]|uniref:DMT family transporter n=1 Tax=Vibrio sp. TH_r3 TaxID=3082084 RepID=UPI0029536E42|nr:DMT family transporter [Vibrio sp. TH_r3]MDV7103074.1 DMT family transporter [Vibrio sp. TH_r3]